jgi:hypothetical protein
MAQFGLDDAPVATFGANDAVVPTFGQNDQVASAPPEAMPQGQPVNLPSNFSSGYGPSVPIGQNPDWAFTGAMGKDALDVVDKTMNNPVTKGLGIGLSTLGKIIAGEAKAGLDLTTGNPDLAKQEMLAAGDQFNKPVGREPVESPWEQGRESLPTIPRASAGVGAGLIETSPQLALSAVDPVIGGLSFGFTPEGFDPVQAGTMLAAPYVGKFLGGAAAKAANKLGVDSTTLLNVVNRASGGAGAAGLLSAPQLSQLAQMPAGTDRDQATEDTLANAISILAMDTMGRHGLSAEDFAKLSPEARKNFVVQQLNNALTGQDVAEMPKPKGQSTPIQQPPAGYVPQKEPVDLHPEAASVDHAADSRTMVQPPAQPAPTAADLAGLQEAIRSNQLKPAAKQAPFPLVDTSKVEVRTPDGELDHVQTHLARMKIEAQQGDQIAEPRNMVEQPPEPAADFGQNDAPVLPSESQPVEPATVEPSQPEAGTATPPAPVASDLKSENIAPSGASSEDFEINPNKMSQYRSTAMLQGDKVIEGKPGENHAMIAEKLGFPPDLIPGFVTKDGQFHYQFEEDVPKASQPEVEAQKNTPVAVTPPAAPEQSATPPQADIDEQHALETVQEAVGLNKVQAARLAELQQKNAAPVPNVESQPANVGTSNVGSKVRKTFYIRPRSDGVHDILDEVQTQGGLKSPATNDVGGEYDGYKEAMTGPAALLRRRNGGLRPDDMVEAVQANFPRIKSADDLYDAIRSATAQRDNLKQNGGGAEAQTQRFWDAVSQPENARGVEKINVDQLNVGQKFRLKMPGWSHDEMTVTHVDPDSGEVTVKDGPTFGQQDLPKGAEIYIRKGTLVDNGIRHSAGDFNFDQPESVADQKQRMAEEKRRLTGQDVDTTGEMFGRYTDKSGQQSMFSAGGNDLTPEQSQRTIKEAINEKHERARTVVQSATQRISHVVRIAADAAFESIKRIAGRTLANTAIDFDFENTEVGKQVQEIAQQQGAKVTFYKGDETTPRGFYDPNTGRLYLRSDWPGSEILNTFEHELVHLNSASSNSTVWHLKNQVDLNSPAARQIRAGYDAWLEYKGLPKLNDELAREEITAYHLTGDHRFGVDPSLAFRNPREAVNLALDYHGAKSLPEGGDSGQIKFNPGTRPAAEVQRDLSAAEDELMAKARAKTDVSTGTQKERNQAANIAAAKLRKLQDELATNDEHVANTIQQQHDAITEANKILKPAGMEWPDIGQVRDKLGDAAARRLDVLANQVADATAALAKTNRLAPKMVDRITNEMMQDGRLPKMAKIQRPNIGRTLKALTDDLNRMDIDSPKASFAERFNVAKKAVETLTAGRDAFKNAWGNSVAASKALWSIFKSAPVSNEFKSVIKSWIGYDTRTAIENANYTRALVAKVPDRVRRMAISVWLDAEGDTSTLKFQRDSVPDKYRNIWDTALKLTPEEKNLALSIKADFAQKLKDGMDTGIIGQGREDYGVPQRWEKKPQNGPGDISGEKRGNPSNPYAKLDPRDPFFDFQRENRSYFDGIMAKGVPENLDIAHLTSLYDEAFHKALSSRGAIKALAEATARDGQPVVKLSGNPVQNISRQSVSDFG